MLPTSPRGRFLQVPKHAVLSPTGCGVQILKRSLHQQEKEGGSRLNIVKQNISSKMGCPE